uniref:Uncharacterized protein n=1 Tax=Anopheles minimus TaxID=112268 RepID=A0A182WA59_9DIPT
MIAAACTGARWARTDLASPAVTSTPSSTRTSAGGAVNHRRRRAHRGKTFVFDQRREVAAISRDK